METRTGQTVGGAPADSDAHSRTLIGFLLADASADVEVVRRDLGLGERLVERLQRALDRLDCAQSILEAEGRSRLGNSGGLRKQVSEAVRVLAENWPQDYPEGAVEWRLVRDGARPR
ncbi:conserved hypothetical protein [Paraburkholderia ribeironis]|uniref:Uncharacterized protein n=1 Tax=Paraburkholderia ribeironis TaxID=1247936 RepID=A0A1N7SE14_9BURK|nr:conserved hypothetical protein [Paraburkholderia ribeironis]